ncbi:ral guanine nucleotide dissociation stimulator-like 3 [Heteronotia binoei]|uniref:ral guanine nucleotide dissociation stimulator-like 3 n=1 Tax=Heteronotia binoei TaxID=13085 RepID=UPI00292F2054|nr:ral guanine nucleotide dissociation stimulator-like 3 [Heteronotia binoei]
MGKAELAMTPLQPWGEEVEEGAIYSILLQRVKAEPEGPPGASPWADPSLPGGCPFVHYRTCKRRVLRAARLPALVRWLLASRAEGDLGYVPSFLATYQAFATLEQVLELLLPLWPDQAVLCVLELWLRDHPEDFWEPPEHPSLQKSLLFLRQVAAASPAAALAEGLLQAHSKQKEEGACGRDAAAEADGGETPGVGLPQAMTEVAGPEASKELPALLSFTVEEVAGQLTLMDSELFRAVCPFHCLGCVWSQRGKKEKQHVAPSVRATVAQFNAVTSCVITSVLEDVTLRVQQRAQVLEKWIDIAQHCRALRNFSSLYAILSALRANPTYRLKRTWAVVNRTARSSFQKLSEIFSEDNNHWNCREILLQQVGGRAGPRQHCTGDGGPRSPTSEGGSSPLQTPAKTPLKLTPCSQRMGSSASHCAMGSFSKGAPLVQRGGGVRRSQSCCGLLQPPTVPYLGTFLTDLVMLDTALPDFVEGNLINFEKRRKEAETLALIRQLQESCQGYSLCPNPFFLAAFRGQQKLSEEQSYRISRVIEPPASSCPNSPKLHRSLTKRFSSLLQGADASPTSPGPDRAGLSLPGPFGSLHPGEGLGPSALPAQAEAGGEGRPSPSPLLLPPQDPPAPLSPTPKPSGAAESRIIRVSLDNGGQHCNLYRSILITSQDKTAAVVQRAVQKHNLGEASLHSYRLLQRLRDGQELLIPSGANTFYAMNPASPSDFLLRRKEEAAHLGSRAPRPTPGAPPLSPPPASSSLPPAPAALRPGPC